LGGGGGQSDLVTLGGQKRLLRPAIWKLELGDRGPRGSKSHPSQTFLKTAKPGRTTENIQPQILCDYPNTVSEKKRPPILGVAILPYIAQIWATGGGWAWAEAVTIHNPAAAGGDFGEPSGAIGLAVGKRRTCFISTIQTATRFTTDTPFSEFSTNSGGVAAFSEYLFVGARNENRGKKE